MRRRFYAQTSTASLETCLTALFCEGTYSRRWTGATLGVLFLASSQPIVESLWFTTAMVELAAFDLLDMALHVRAHIKVSFRIA